MSLRVLEAIGSVLMLVAVVALLWLFLLVCGGVS